MTNKQLSNLLFVSLGLIVLIPVLGVTSWVFYAAGALATLVLGAMVLSRLYLEDKRHWFPYAAGVVMFVFWSLAFIATDGLTLIAPLYMIALIWAGIKLNRL